MYTIYPDPDEYTPIRPQSFDNIEDAVRFGNSMGCAFIMEAFKR